MYIFAKDCKKLMFTSAMLLVVNNIHGCTLYVQCIHEHIVVVSEYILKQLLYVHVYIGRKVCIHVYYLLQAT